MARGRIGLIGLLLFALRPVAAADDPAPADLQRERKQRLEFMKGKLAEFAIELDKEPPVPMALADEPALRWTNPVRNVEVDGATFFWSKGGRPAAIATMSIRAEGKVFREIALLGDEPLVARRRERIVWTPKKNGVSFGPLANAPAPARSISLRLAQMRTQARRFKAGLIKGNRVEARLLSQPLLRYADSENGLVDGAVFAFAEGTDPEILVLLEDRKDQEHPDGRWFFSVARMTSPPAEVELDEKVIWSAPGYWTNPKSRDDSYVEAFEGVYESEK
jgi:hypothetical protein